MKLITRSLAGMAFSGLFAFAQYAVVDLNPSPTALANVNALGAGVQGGFAAGPGTQSPLNAHAYLWTGTAGSASDINPSGWLRSQIQAISGSQQVGWGNATLSADASNGAHALLWYGTAASFVDLNPAALDTTVALCTTGTLQGGYGIAPVKNSKGNKTVPSSHAYIWFGSAASATDLNPSGIAESKIYGCAGDTQVGYGSKSATGFTHAMMWSGSAASSSDLNPAHFDSSLALSVSGTQQVGTGITGGNRHAVLWSGSAASAVDLHPAGYVISIAYSTNGVQQAGEATDNGFPQRKHAMVWSGSAATALDLNQFLPANFVEAHAAAIDAAGNVAGWASQADGTTHAILWVRAQ